jgi:hypothetical protein
VTAPPGPDTHPQAWTDAAEIDDDPLPVHEDDDYNFNTPRPTG